MTDQWINALLRPDAYPHPVNQVSLQETHISWVLLTGNYAYKIKKPVDFGFLDFSSLEQRQFFCQEEVRLNRRFTPEIYLGVAPICGSPEQPQVDGNGEAFEYAVKMQQFPQESILSNLAQQQQLDDPLLEQLAVRVARIHSEAPSLYPQSGAGTIQTFDELVRENFSQIRDFDIDAAQSAIVDKVEAWALAQLEQLTPLMQERLKQGYIKDCHGDLHLGNLALIEGKVQLFDCIEFFADYRIMDTIAEVAFLTMDMQARGYDLAAATTLDAYLRHSEDQQGLELLAQYRCYYAIVRAKVALFGAPQDSPLQQSEAYRTFKNYLALALSYC